MHVSINLVELQCHRALRKRINGYWNLDQSDARSLDPLMGWTSSADTQTQGQALL